MFHFFALPAWQLLDKKGAQAIGAEAFVAEEALRPSETEPSLIEPALAGVEYRGYKAWERALELLTGEKLALFAKAPQDLPALLRTADQLLTIAKVDAGERAQLWRCSCGTRYAVPVSLVRPVSLRCERCGNTVDLDPTRGLGEERITDPQTAAINSARLSLSVFFREAMARGWPVLIEKI